MIGRLFVVIAVFLGLGVLPIQAKIYDIPEALWTESKQLEDLLAQNPTSNEVKFELAMNYAYTGRIQKGWGLLKAVPQNYADQVLTKYLPKIEAEPKEWRHRFKVAFAHYFKKERDKAKGKFLEVLDIDPNQVWAMGFVALLEGENGNNDAAIVWCKKALAIEANATAVHFLLGEAYRRKGMYFNMLGEAMIVGRLKTEEAAKRR